MAKPDRYSTVQITLHWLVAILVLAAWFTNEDMGRELRDRIEAGTTGVEGNTLHVWFGGAAFAVILLRIVVRLVRGAPDHVPGTSPMMGKAASWGHRLLYLLMLVTPALGAAAWYGHQRTAGEVHEIVAVTLMIVALGDAVVALYHHYFLKDVTMRRMIRPGA